ncbi:MAG: hypothetical protein OEV49_14265 [candidate division Zixibacteria bacterium]|nr:hypothetical protein [candidate division Zixibacteria bacterium]MDH3937796.1 hypothetical protein [candidate division Zixibacteria bacterium]MDH4034607.1 hypothetical protein [candidate division Zixibacteria bacterium]
MRSLPTVLAAMMAGLVLLIGCAEEPPARNHIPILKERLFKLQEAVKVQNRAAIDSLLSVQILDVDQDSDSLLKFTYGTDGSFAFRQFATGGIVYTNETARIECYTMDSTQTRDRPLILTYVFEHDQWLLKRFEPGEVEADSSDAI